MRPVAVALAAALLAPGAALAQPVSSPSGPGPDTYLELHLGAFLPQSDALDSVDAGYAFGGTFGARFSPYLGVEGELGLVRAIGSARGLETSFTDVPFAASFRLRAPFKRAEVSLLGGAALHFVSLSREVDVSGTVTRDRDSASVFGFHAGIAVGFQLSPTMLVGAEARRTFLEPRFDDTRVRLDGLRVALTLVYHL
jgi:opacity protein-like surface antigen